MIEVLASMVLLAVVSAGLYGMVGLSRRGWIRGALELTWRQAGHRALEVMVNDFESLAMRSRIPQTFLRTPHASDYVYLSGEVDRCTWLLLRIQTPLTSSLWEVRYEMKEGTLLRWEKPQIALSGEGPLLGDEGTRAWVEAVLSDVTALVIDYQTPQGAWLDEWTTPRLIPRAIRVTLARLHPKTQVVQRLMGFVRFAS